MLNELERLRILGSYRILDTEPEESFEQLVQTAARLFDVPIALVSLIDHDRQWFKARHGLDISESTREISFCRHIIDSNETLVVPDARDDERFKANPLVTGSLNICAYAGAPLRSPEGAVLGSLCVIDTRAPREFTAHEIELLEALARSVVAQFETRKALQQVNQSRASLETLRGSRQEFIKQAAHDLRTPVSIIMGYAQMIRESFGEDLDTGVLEQDLETICEASELLLKRLNEAAQQAEAAEEVASAPDHG